MILWEWMAGDFSSVLAPSRFMWVREGWVHKDCSDAWSSTISCKSSSPLTSLHSVGSTVATFICKENGVELRWQHSDAILPHLGVRIGIISPVYSVDKVPPCLKLESVLSGRCAYILIPLCRSPPLPSHPSFSTRILCFTSFLCLYNYQSFWVSPGCFQWHGIMHFLANSHFFT